MSWGHTWLVCACSPALLWCSPVNMAVSTVNGSGVCAECIFGVGDYLAFHSFACLLKPWQKQMVQCAVMSHAISMALSTDACTHRSNSKLTNLFSERSTGQSEFHSGKHSVWICSRHHYFHYTVKMLWCKNTFTGEEKKGTGRIQYNPSKPIARHCNSAILLWAKI